MNYKRKYRRPYKSSMQSRYRKPANLYKLPSKGGGGSYRPRTPYILSHNTLRYPPEPKYRLEPEAGRSQPIIIKSEPDHYRVPKIEYKPEQDIDQLLEKIQKKFDETLEEKIIELFGEELKPRIEPDSSLDKYVENADQKTESITDIDNDETSNQTEEDLPDEDVDKELHEDKVEVQKDMMMSDEAETYFENLAVDELDSDAAIAPRDIPDRPPEEAMYPNESFIEMAESVLENPLLAYDIDSRIWPEIEALVIDLKAEQIEPKAESVEPGY